MISDLLSGGKILLYATYLSRKLVSSHVTNLLTPECHLADDAFSHVVLTWPRFGAFRAFAFCMSLGDIHRDALTSEGAGLIWMDCCWHSRFCGGRSRSLVHREVGDWVFALVVWADVIGPVSRVRVPRLCGGVGMAS